MLFESPRLARLCEFNNPCPEIASSQGRSEFGGLSQFAVAQPCSSTCKTGNACKDTAVSLQPRPLRLENRIVGTPFGRRP